MFGGICWLLNGNMCVGVYKDWPIVRVGVESAEEILREKHVKPMDVTGKAMKGWAMVAPAGIRQEDDLKRFVEAAHGFVKKLPRK